MCDFASPLYRPCAHSEETCIILVTNHQGLHDMHHIFHSEAHACMFHVLYFMFV